MGDGEKLLTYLNSALKALLGFDIFPRVPKKSEILLPSVIFLNNINQLVFVMDTGCVLSEVQTGVLCVNPLNAELNPIYHLLALLEAHHILHLSRVRVNYMTVIIEMVQPAFLLGVVQTNDLKSFIPTFSGSLNLVTVSGLTVFVPGTVQNK